MNDLKYLKSQTNKEFQNKNPLYDVFSTLRETINALENLQDAVLVANKRGMTIKELFG